MFCWGSTVNGELGLGGLEEETISDPREIQFSRSEDIVEVGCGECHSAFVLNDGTVYTCGSNDYGQLGHSKPRKRPEQVEGLNAQVIRHVACGSSHTLAINEWGQIFAWGSDLKGQLGIQLGIEHIIIPKIVKTLATKQVVQIACGDNHSLALTNTGELYSWGSNSHGQLGLGNRKDFESTPCQIKTLSGIPISLIACGGNHSFAVSKSGAVYGWGKNTFGQLGLGDTENRPFPVQLESLRFLRVTYMACGADHTAVLTQDGGVFTFGAGMYGQLGHGSSANEMVPRKILELMGSTVTQIACGRCHTLALVPSRGRVYAFGLGGSGQLGIKKNRNINSPLPVLGPWVSPSGATLMDTDATLNGMKNGIDTQKLPVAVRKIFCGGDQSFALVSVHREGFVAADYRERPPDTQILSITSEKVKQMRTAEASETADQDLLCYVETVFATAACYNGSFLKDDGSHFGCSSKNHGLDLCRAEESFAQISRIENTTLSETVFRCLCSDLLPGLSPYPPDVEGLRVYLLLPLYHEFLQPKHYEQLHCPLAEKIISLKKEAAQVIDSWWSLCKTDYFVRVVNIFKNVVIHLLESSVPTNPIDARNKGWALKCALDMLQRLNAVNRQSGSQKVGHDCFYIPQVTTKVDVGKDYLTWLVDTSKDNFHLCNYPFIFDAQAKTLLLQTDQSIQMQTAMNEATSRMYLSQLFQPASVIANMRFLVLEVRRDHLVQDAITQLSRCDPADLRKPLKVKFRGEEAEDAGGVRKEFFMLLLKEILDPKYGMFKYYEETRNIWFSDIAVEEQQDRLMFYLIGLVCGLAIYNFTIINLSFPLALYKKLLGEPVTLDDLAGLSPTLLRSLHSLLEYENDDLEDVFSLNFVVTRDVYGALVADELKPNGKEIAVTQQNKQEYVDLYVDYVFNKSIKTQFAAFYDGFHKVCSGRVLKLFQAHELMELVVGNENFDWYELERNTEYKNGYSADHPTIRLFWEVFHDLSHEQKKTFLLFLTGSDRIPILGMKALKLIIQRTGGGASYLPVAHTCFNLLDLPEYTTKEKLRYKLLQAIQHSQGFGLA